MIGRTIGRYRVLSKLGEGGMGSVYKAEDSLLGRLVALKFLPESCTEQDCDRFRRSLRAAAALHHPAIAQVHEAGDVDGRPYAVLGFVDGDTVAQWMAEGPLSVPDAIRIAIACAEGLGYAHANGVIHRDIKPGNIMVARDGRVFIVDFGLAWKQGSTHITSENTRMGTDGYIAPEVLRGLPADPRSDLYSLGVVLYEMLTGSRPFGGRREAQDYQTLNEPATPPSRMRAGMPARLDGVALRSLEKLPERRYQDASGLIADLRAGLPGEPRGGFEPPPVSAAPSRARIPDHKYVAVLPFLASGMDEDGEILPAGFAEALSVGLGRLPGVRVIRPAATGEDAASDDAFAVAARTGANLVVRGSLRRSDTELRVSWSLVQPAAGTQLAGGTITVAQQEVFELEDRLLSDVTAALGFGPDVPVVPARARGADAAAHERYLLALGYLRRHENEASVDGAIALLQRLIENASDVAAYHAALGRACLRKHQLGAGSVWLNRAAQACERAMTLEPGSPDVLLALGEIRTATGQSVEAVEAYRQALAIRSDDSEIVVALSRALEAAGQLELAEDEARRAIRLKPDDWRGYNRLGVLLYHRGEYARGLEALREVTRLSPDNARGWYNAGSALYHLDRMDEALEAYRRAIATQPTARAYAWLGAVHFYMGRPDEAIRAYEMARDLNPADPMGWGNLGGGLRWWPGHEAAAREPLERAVTLMRRHLDENGRDAQGWSHLANWLGHLGRLDEAKRSIELAIELAPQDAIALQRAAYVHHLRGERAPAIARLKEAIARGYSALKLAREPSLAGLVEDPEVARMFARSTAGKKTLPLEMKLNPGGEA